LSFTCLIAAVILPKLGTDGGKEPNRLSWAFINFGLISYSFYLIHSQFGWLVSIFVPSQGAAIGPFFIRVGAMLLSIIPIYYFFKFFEKPFFFAPMQESRLYRVYRRLGNLFGVS